MQPPSLIPKAELRVPPNPPLGWEQARRALCGLPGGGLNIAHEADYAKLGTLDEIVACLAQKKPA